MSYIHFADGTCESVDDELIDVAMDVCATAFASFKSYDTLFGSLIFDKTAIMAHPLIHRVLR